MEGQGVSGDKGNEMMELLVSPAYIQMGKHAGFYILV